MKIIIVFKTGFQLPITCEEFSLNKNMGKPIGFKTTGVTDNDPMCFDFNEVLCIYRDLNAE